MKLILVRHGHALNHDIDGLRPLSEQGKSEAKDTGQFLQSFFKDIQQSGPHKIFHSELLRAKETALLIAGQLSRETNLEEAQDLLPHSSPSTWMNNLYAFEEEDTIALVGHMPFMGIFASELLKLPVNLPTGGCLIFERDEDNHTFKEIKRNY